jgi:hypothetical protein
VALSRPRTDPGSRQQKKKKFFKLPDSDYLNFFADLHIGVPVEKTGSECRAQRGVTSAQENLERVRS